jgi:hypothetical protein
MGLAGSYEMPLGQDRFAPGATREEAPYPHSPLGDEELKRLKQLPAGPLRRRRPYLKGEGSSDVPTPEICPDEVATRSKSHRLWAHIKHVIGYSPSVPS